MVRNCLMIAVLSLAALAGAAAAAGLGQKCGRLMFFTGLQCDAGLWCQMPAGQCGVADGVGTCAKAPEICNQIFRPVCGCDNRTYGNDCERQAQKVAKAHDGPCK